MTLIEMTKKATGKHPHNGRIYYTTYGIYQCECGNVVTLTPCQAKRTKSCGCKLGNPTHGLCKKHPLYNTWCGMRSRCGSKTSPYYYRYGGRGIKVCHAWNASFAEFYQWGLANGWKQGLTLERINNNAGYSPGNCCFITRARQARNRRPNKLTEKKVMAIRALYNTGARVCDLAKLYGVTPTTVCKIVHNKIWKG
jgi:hypothetical protein